MPQYSNARAMRALIKASLQAIVKSPSAIVFSIAFPLIFILVFGFLGGGSGRFSISVAKAPGSDTANQLYMALQNVPVLKWKDVDSASLSKSMQEGVIAATIAVTPNSDSSQPRYSVVINASSSQMDKAPQLQGIINSVVQSMDPEIARRSSAIASIEVKESVVREYKMIDFILPGQLGFSLLAGSVFGTAFVFFNLRQTLVLKRFFATPVRREVIVIAEGIARMVFQLLGAVIIICVGHFAFGFTLVNGFFTIVELILLSALGIMVFMGFGFIVSSIAKSDATIPPFANIITLPQFLLGGTFFPIDNFPKWMQPFCRVLPLSYLNDAMRKIAFEGLGVWEIKWDLFALLIWGVVVYTVASRMFKWE
ncbi:MAG: ABC transporter permease [Bacteroidetes bacterium 43-93]|nr:ABC transporter permease [Bacteroidota bacterium]OJX01536.1 MAG: ABC transporter permease [Bacteroidetes bacterium 43-93]